MVATAPRASFSPGARRLEDTRFIELASELASQFAPDAADHDRDNTFVNTNFTTMRESGYIRLAVPEELGGLGASMRQTCFAQAALARGCASTALAVNMHHYLVLANAYRWRHGAAAAEGVLRKVADTGLVLMTSGGSDGIWPGGTAVREGNGFRISGRKAFCSQAPVAGVLVCQVGYDDTAEGKQVLLVSIPMSSDGIEIIETWDTLGMRATASHDIQLTDVRITDAQVVARRPWGKVDRVLRVTGIHFSLPVASVYLGVAMAARDEAVRLVQSRRFPAGPQPGEDPIIQRNVGLMDARLKVAWWSLTGALDELEGEFEPDGQTLAMAMIAKREVITAAVEVVDLAMTVAGGAGYFKRSPLERAYRDVRAGEFHPIPPEKTVMLAGQLGLGQPADTIW